MAGGGGARAEDSKTAANCNTNCNTYSALQEVSQNSFSSRNSFYSSAHSPDASDTQQQGIVVDPKGCLNKGALTHHVEKMHVRCKKETYVRDLSEHLTTPRTHTHRDTETRTHMHTLPMTPQHGEYRLGRGNTAHRNTLQHTATQHSTTQHRQDCPGHCNACLASTPCNAHTLHHTTTHRNTLQHTTPPHCNTCGHCNACVACTHSQTSLQLVGASRFGVSRSNPAHSKGVQISQDALHVSGRGGGVRGGSFPHRGPFPSFTHPQSDLLSKRTRLKRSQVKKGLCSAHHDTLKDTTWRVQPPPLHRNRQMHTHTHSLFSGKPRSTLCEIRDLKTIGGVGGSAMNDEELLEAVVRSEVQ